MSKSVKWRKKTWPSSMSSSVCLQYYMSTCLIYIHTYIWYNIINCPPPPLHDCNALNEKCTKVILYAWDNIDVIL